MLTFLGIGAQKSGTTWLYETLGKHPKIAFPGGKEVHYWNQKRGRGFDWYQRLFADDSKTLGDITPAYGFLPVEVINEIHDLMPKLRLIYLIRNPVERAWSAARMALGRAEMHHEDASDQWFIDHFKSRGSLARGNYELCIRQWRSVFPPDQLLIVRYDAICSDPVGVANRCLDHLGLESHFEASHRRELGASVFEGDNVPLRPSLIPPLLDIYSSRIESLEQYLGEDYSAWKSEFIVGRKFGNSFAKDSMAACPSW